MSFRKAFIKTGMNFIKKSIADKIKQGNIKAFEQLFRDLYAPLCAYANKYVDDKDKSEELVQNTFYNLWKNRKSLNIKSSLKSYLYKSVQNACLLQIQHEKVKEKYRTHILNTEKTGEERAPDKLLEIKELNKNIQETMEKLPERCREIFYLNRYEGLKYREIAEKLSISQKTVEANISKALKLLRKNLSNNYRILN
ncbi:MAG: RNA polymerase sigma-70 factor [Bacteroidales bacterium]|nr:RNA polymerase sigma-70 factor [Bacteroidales bacterium]